MAQEDLIASVNLSELTLEIRVKPVPETASSIERICAQAKYRENVVASLDALRISRARCAVRPHFVEPGRRSGNGCWGREMNTGALIYILDLNVNESYRAKGVGTWTLVQFLTSEDVKLEDIVGCWPKCSHCASEGVKKVAFLRKNHFRRIGRTDIFGYSPKSDHPSRSIPLDGDVGLMGEDFPLTTDSPLDIQHKFPLHSAIANNHTANIAKKIQCNGLTPISVAVGIKNIVAIRKLLEWDLQSDLENSNNEDGITPLERLAGTMGTEREFSEVYLGWSGYSDDDLTIQYLLRQAMGHTVEANVTDYIAKNKYGCTCGRCAGGWLSPRMRFSLEVDAAFWADSMPMEFDTFSEGQPSNPGDMMDNPSRFIPPSLRPNFYLSFYKGYCDVLRAVYLLLSNTNQILSVATVTPFLTNDDDSRFFFQNGGRTEFAFDAITQGAKDASSLCDNTMTDTFGDDWASLPTCANDLEFQLVREMLGLHIDGEWGPYDDIHVGVGPADSDEESGEDEDEDDGDGDE
ncbi:hypothetical protein C8R46DRAFT_1052489 [Mycena filopes]|nr:hypothetical protein C8R46DRAFT_1052489 [Mycena filopes]